jgi:hypothetical protein
MASTSTSFLNGYSSRKEVLGLLSFPDMLDPNAMFCRFYSYVQGSWGTFDLQFQCKSLTVRIDEKNGYRGWCVLGKNGEIADIAGGNPPRISQISGAGLNVMRPYGYVEAIKQIDGELYVCGYGRQVYKLVDEQWLSISDEILTRERAIGFFDIDGKDERHIYAVGWKGEIYQYDGEDWHKDDSPTTAHLASVRVLGQNEVWICGDKGVVLHGHFNQWTQLGSDAFTGNWYSIESFNGKIYLAGNDVLACIEDGEIKRVEPGLGKPLTMHRLHAQDGMLWVIGRAHILTYDGVTWKEIHHPDNA